jgi:hypothetical protein
MLDKIFSYKNIMSCGIKTVLVFYGAMIGYYNHGFIHEIKQNIQYKINDALSTSNSTLSSEDSENKFVDNSLFSPLEEIVQIKKIQIQKKSKKSVEGETNE